MSWWRGRFLRAPQAKASYEAEAAAWATAREAEPVARASASALEAQLVLSEGLMAHWLCAGDRGQGKRALARELATVKGAGLQGRVQPTLLARAQAAARHGPLGGGDA